MSEHLESASKTSLRDATYEPFGNDLFQLTLSRKNKAEIFEYALTKADQYQDEATTMLHNIAIWDQSTAALFAPRSSATMLDTPFRLIFPKSALPAFEETGLYVRQYTAISYCWRSSHFVPEEYETDGDWPISKSFVDAILEDKGHDRQGIWMDQLCIDQTSSIDKQKSVAAMDVIYKSCLRLLVLLEDVFFDQDEADLCERYDLKNNSVPYQRSWVPPTDERAVFASCYHKINAARWWERSWCHHEFSVNEPWSNKRQSNEVHNATFIVNGPDGSTVKIKWYTLHKIMVTALDFSPELAGTITTECKGQAILTGLDQDEREPGWRGSIMARYNGMSRKECLNLEDKLSVMINMCGIGLAYRGHAVTNRDEVLYLSALLAFAAGEAYPLTMFNGNVTVMFRDRRTWLHRHYAGDDTTIPKFKIGGLRGIHGVSMEEIDLDMIFLPSPESWDQVKDENLQLTYEVFPGIIPTTEPAQHGRDNHAYGGPDDVSIDIPRRRFLMSCIVQGHTFTARLWAQLNNEVVGPNYNQGLYKDLASNPSFYGAAQKLIAQLLPISTILCVPPPSSFTLEDAQLFLTWLTDPRSLYYISMFSWQVQCTLSGQRALATAVHTNDHFKDGPFKELRAAVPIDLVGASCMLLRVWLLRPGKSEDGSEKWRLVAKTMLLGEPDLLSEANARESGAVKLRRTIVGG